MSSGAIIQTRDLRKTYLVGKVQVQALREVDVEAPAGDFLPTQGPSASGTATLFQLHGGLPPAAGGRVHVGGGERP